MKTLHDALDALATAISNYIDENMTGSGLKGRWPAIMPGHPVHAAVVAAEQFYADHMLPREGRLLWVELLELSRNSDPSIESYKPGCAAYAVYNWAKRQLTPESPTAGSSAPAPIKPDGPELPNMFWWKGKGHNVEPLPCRLLTHLWKHRGQNVEKTSVEQAVWGDALENDGAFKSAQNKANGVLFRAETGLQITTKNGYVMLG